MASLNKVLIIGNLTRDVELRYTPNGAAVADISIAINRKYSTDSGEKREEVTYVDVTLWAKLAELAAQYLQKGKPVMIEGRLSAESWEDKTTGQKRSKMKVIGENMQFLGVKSESEDNGEPRQQSRPQSRPIQKPQTGAGPRQNFPTKREFDKANDDWTAEDDSSIPF